ncbi:MAG: acyl carrier protein [Patescibacteria group bacterium]
MSEEILDKIKQIVSEQLDVPMEEIKPDSDFVKDLGADSLDLTEFVMAMEDAFDLEIDDEVAQTLTNIEEVVRYIENTQAVS